jgi:hypothetical protein
MRSYRVDLNFFKKFCSDAYGEGTWAKVTRKNIEYGGLNQRSSNIIFSNGVEGNYLLMKILGDGLQCNHQTTPITWYE